MIWAADNDDGTDTLQIKIWEETDGVENIIYNNGSDQPLGGGMVQVHKAAKPA